MRNIHLVQKQVHMRGTKIHISVLSNSKYRFYQCITHCQYHYKMVTSMPYHSFVDHRSKHDGNFVGLQPCFPVKLTNLVRRSTDWRVMNYWSHRSCTGHPTQNNTQPNCLLKHKYSSIQYNFDDHEMDITFTFTTIAKLLRRVNKKYTIRRAVHSSHQFFGEVTNQITNFSVSSHQNVLYDSVVIAG